MARRSPEEEQEHLKHLQAEYERHSNSLSNNLLVVGMVVVGVVIGLQALHKRIVEYYESISLTSQYANEFAYATYPIFLITIAVLFYLLTRANDGLDKVPFDKIFKSGARIAFKVFVVFLSLGAIYKLFPDLSDNIMLAISVVLMVFGLFVKKSVYLLLVWVIFAIADSAFKLDILF